MRHAACEVRQPACRPARGLTAIVRRTKSFADYLMAEYQLTQEEYEALTRKLRPVRSWWGRGVARVLGTLLILGMFALLIYLHQWLFVILLSVCS